MRENVKCYAIRIIVHNKIGIIFNGAARIKRSYFQSLTMTEIYRDLSGKGSPDREQGSGTGTARCVAKEIAGGV